jgi:hypothetical protein
MQRFNEFSDRRASSGRDSNLVPGFYQVRVGSLVEIGDQTLDDRGRPCPVTLDQVGREVTLERIVLRIDRRQPKDRF